MDLNKHIHCHRCSSKYILRYHQQSTLQQIYKEVVLSLNWCVGSAVRSWVQVSQFLITPILLKILSRGADKA
jgi:hypothetical protein